MQSLCLLLFMAGGSLYGDAFTVGDIRVQGLQRAPLGTVLEALPVRIGDRFDEADTPELIGVLYKTGLFENVEIKRAGNVLHIRVVERPGIASIEVDAVNENTQTVLIDVLKSEGVAVGKIFDRVLVDRIRSELQQQFFAIGKYGASIEIDVNELEERQVGLVVKVHESEVAKIRAITLKGNTIFSDEEILDKIESQPSAWYDFFGGSDEYSRLKLGADLDAIRKLYFDAGYLDFAISDVHVSLDRRQESIYIEIEMKEGRRYTIDKIRIGGDMPVERKALRELVPLKKGDIFSRSEALQAGSRMEGRLGNEGYAFAEVTMVPEPRRESGKVDLNYVVQSGRKVYVRRINISGNMETSDSVFRRELRQMESAPYSGEKIELSKRRLLRLPYVASAEIENERLPEGGDLLDLNVSVAERLSGYYNFGVGLSSAEGAVLSFQLNQDNFLGTGNRVGFTFSNSKSNRRYGINFVDPYYTADGIRRRIAVSHRATDFDEQDVADVETKETRVELGLGLPVTENDVLGLGWTLQTISLNLPAQSTRVNTDIREFVEREGGDFLNPLILSAGIGYDSRDRNLFPTEGSRINANIVLFPPGINDLNYVKLSYDQQRYFPLDEDRDYVLYVRARASYAKAFGNTFEVPFYDKFYAGGSGSVRGYSSNSLGPQEADGDPRGGDVRLIGNFQLFFPSGWLYDPQRMRIGAFTDVGNVFDENDIDLGELRASYGLHVQWLTAVGGISFSFANQLNDSSEDDTESFHFDLGSGF